MSKMTVVYLGAKKGKGVSSKKGVRKPYDFCQVTYGVKADDYIAEDHDIRAFGVKEMSIDLSVEAFPSFHDVKPYRPVSLLLEPDPSNPSRNICVGFELPAK
jgi:hypothetical protein